MILLRPATLGDAARIASVHLMARREAMPYLPVVHTEDETFDWVRDVVIPQQTVWVAASEDGIDGYIAMTADELNDLYVRPGAQGKGVGTALLDKARELSAGTLRLWTFQRNSRARDFYERRGFVAIEMTDGQDNEEREPDIRYEWTRSDMGSR
ncbi:MAG TPA: GNAT family N-acetyltransferase [Thermomicrobiales bacterium]|nr:GNAT family N-acetyltransferase [Thermomicrobiales bacterium]